MLPTLQVIMPMSGSGARFIAAGYLPPKPLIEAAGRPLVSHLVERFPSDTRWVFVARKDHLETTALREVLESCVHTPHIVAISPHKEGPVHAVIAAHEVVDSTLPTIINYCDFSFTWDVNHFRRWALELDLDGAVMCYRGFHPHHQGDARYAYCKTDHFGRILQVKEKEAFTDMPTNEWASTGSYYFRTGELALARCREHVALGRRVNGEHYASLVMDDMARHGERVHVYEIDTFCQWGTPQDLEDWHYWSRAFEALDRHRRREIGSPEAHTRPRHVLMPMGGKGVRLRDLGAIKPLIPLHGAPLFQSALRFLPPAERPILVVRREHHDALVDALRPERRDVMDWVVFDGDTDGQASTAWLAAEHLLKSPDAPLWVSACDHGVVLDPLEVNALEQSSAEVGVVGVRGYPPARRDPEAYSWLDADLESLGEVRQIGLKALPRDSIHAPAVLVGTFYFRSSHDFVALLRHLLEAEIRTGGERYLDAIVQLALTLGRDVRYLKSEAFLCWGTQSALEEYRYWHRHFRGASP